MVPVDFSETSVRNSTTEICGSHGRELEDFDDGSIRIVETSLLCQVQDDFDGKTWINIALET